MYLEKLKNSYIKEIFILFIYCRIFFQFVKYFIGVNTTENECFSHIECGRFFQEFSLNIFSGRFCFGLDHLISKIMSHVINQIEKQISQSWMRTWIFENSFDFFSISLRTHLIILWRNFLKSKVRAPVAGRLRNFCFLFESNSLINR